MSESTFDPFGGPGQDEAVHGGDDGLVGDAGRRRNLLLLGGLGAVALAGAAFVFLGGGGGDAADAAAIAPQRPATAPAPAAEPSPKADPEGPTLTAGPVVQLGRSPFKALYVAPAAAGGGGAAGGGSADGAVPAAGSLEPVVTNGTAPPASGSTGGLGGSPTITLPELPPVTELPGSAGSTALPPVVMTPVVPSLPEPAATTGGTGGGSTKPAQSTVALGKVVVVDGKPTGTFRYDGQTLTGKPGDVMGGRLLVISLQQDPTGAWFANLQLGDGTPFEVHQRQTVVVQ